MTDRDAMIEWLEQNCPSKIEYDFWFSFYDDLDDCFDGLEPWRMFAEWPTWDKKFTGRLIPGDPEPGVLLPFIPREFRFAVGPDPA